MDFFKGIFVKVKKEVTLGALLSVIIPIGVSIFLWAFTLSGKVQVNSETLNIRKSRFERIEKSIEDSNDRLNLEIKDNYKILDKKVDKILELMIDKK